MCSFDCTVKSKTPALSLASERLKTRFPDVELSRAERKIARRLWNEINRELELGVCVTQKLDSCTERVQQAIMRAVALRVLNSHLPQKSNPFS